MDFQNGMSCHDKEPDHLSLLIFLMHLSYELFISQRTHVTIKLPVSCSVGHLKKKIHYNYDVTVLSTLRFRFKTTRYSACARCTEYCSIFISMRMHLKQKVHAITNPIGISWVWSSERKFWNGNLKLILFISGTFLVITLCSCK